MFRIGDIVRVKSQTEIESTLDDDYTYDGLDYDDDDMWNFSGHIYKIGNVDFNYVSPRYSLYPIRFSSYNEYLISEYKDEDDYIGNYRWVDVWLEPFSIGIWEGL